LKGTLGAAFSRLPWSLIAVDRFVRMRRAVRTERAAATAHADTLGALIMTERDRVDRELAQWQTDVPALFPPGWTLSSLRVALRRPAVILWLVILTPSVLWFVVGGWPQTAGLQVFMKQPAVWMVLFPVAVLAQAWIAWRTLAGLRSWSKARGASIGDDAAIVGLRVACGIGAVSLGTFSLLRMLGGVAPGSNLLASLHAQDAANRLTPGGGSMVAGSAGAFAPPPPTLELPNTAGSSPGTSNSNADSGRTSTPPPTKRAPPPAPLPPDEAAAARAAAADALAAQEQARAAQERVRAAHDAQDAADIAAADDFKDPWGEKTPEQVRADETREAAKDAEARRDEAVNAAEAAKEQVAAQQQAAEQHAAAQQRAADPEGVAADEAARAAGAAEKRANKTFMETDEYDSSGNLDPSGAERRHAADQAAILARQQADAARAAADAAKAARETSAAQNTSTGWKPDKP
jgi:hypothetical protein